jgi:hypothetical protein
MTPAVLVREERVAGIEELRGGCNRGRVLCLQASRRVNYPLSHIRISR